MTDVDVARYGRHVSPEFVKLLGVYGYGRVFVRAKDVHVWDREGRRYLDLLAGFGSVNLGHNHPRVVDALRAALGSDPLNLVHVGPSVLAGALAERLVHAAGEPFEIALLTSSGAEAVEAGLKLARAATGRARFVSCRAGFHGTNLGTLSVLATPRMRKPFEPLLPGCEAIPWGDLDALEALLRAKDVAAFLVEPIAAEGGVLLLPPGWLATASALCRKAGTLLVLDEVQTGLGRTGALFAFQRENVVPDVLVLAKSLGGGLAPIGAALTSRAWHRDAYGSMARFDLHGSTFSGNTLACAAALATLDVLADEELAENAETRGTELLAALRTALAGHPFVADVRGRGLLVGIELGPNEAVEGLVSSLPRPLAKGVAELVLGQWAALRLLEKGFVCQPASQSWSVLKLTPPLTMGGVELSGAVAAIREVLDDYESVGPLLRDVAVRLSEQVVMGGAFR